MRVSFPIRVVWGVAAFEAAMLRHPDIEPNHLWLGLLSLEKALEDDGNPLSGDERRLVRQAADQVRSELDLLGLQVDPLRQRLRALLQAGPEGQVFSGHRSAAAREMFERAEYLARNREVTVRHLISALLNDPTPEFSQVFEAVKGLPRQRGPAEVSRPPEPAPELPPPEEEPGLPPAAYRPVEGVPVRSGHVPGKVTIARDLEKFFEEQESRRQKAEAAAFDPDDGLVRQDERNVLGRFGRDLSMEARRGKLGPFVGRERELSLMVQCLLRASKNNPVLVGEAGVGKTAVVEALAVDMVKKPDHPLRGRRIIEISIGQMVAGTKYRGEFEQRMLQLVKEAGQQDVILFIDEIHTLVGSGSASNVPADGADLLKPALARGTVRLIGATTSHEYQQFIEADPALERRFDRVVVEEPTPAQSVEIARGIQPRLEQHHKVRYPDQVLQAAVDLSVRFLTDRRLPDKAIDLLDRAGSRARAERVAEVDAALLARTLAEMLNVPVELIVGHEPGGASPILTLEAALKQRLVGQDEAVERVCQRLALSQAGLVQRRGPVGVFLLLGPPGVGKTELARGLAEHLFDSPDALIRLDMSEYQEAHSITRLIGAPPGYVGHDKPSPVLARLRSQPHSVVLLDEVEKAHPEVFDLFLQVFDDGRLTDARGRATDLRQCIFVLTSNLMAKDRSRGLGIRRREEQEKGPPPELLRHFRRELLDRLDEVVFLRPLEREDAEQLVHRMLGELERELDRRYGVRLKVASEVIARVASEGLDPETGGVRGLRRCYETLLLMPLSKRALAGDLKKGDVLKVDSGPAGLLFKVVSRLRKEL
ncbi:MAG: ATP-dependent Clp protease ATP-binding subunit [Candidatus Eremiobacterota bacterium]